jgi:bacterioferritin-associated ferredoxin
VTGIPRPACHVPRCGTGFAYEFTEAELLRIVLIRANIYLWVDWVVTGKIMIICICHRVSERDIDHAVSEGASSLRQLNERLGVGTGCGACVEHVRDYLNHRLADDLAHMGMQRA